MKMLIIIVVMILALAAFVVGTDWLSAHAYTTRVQAVRVGDTRHQVEQIMGRPVTTFTPFAGGFLSVRSETWAYGSRLELRDPFGSEFPYFWPVRIRIFMPDADDVAIQFDSSGRVSKIVTP